MPELLRSPQAARLIFYGILVAAVMWTSRQKKMRGLALLGSVVVLGVVIKLLSTAFWPEWFVQPELAVSVAQSVVGPLAKILNLWMLFPVKGTVVGNTAFLLAIVLLLAIVRLQGRARDILLVPTLYTLAFVWEMCLVEEPSITRMLILGILLVLTMNYRPQGLFGARWMARS
ncbi:MAG: hypothetical protein JXA89_15100 [Anaerolineae bacterium]|nr:hypothetical protein [Anaerolineae bacterium]